MAPAGRKRLGRAAKAPVVAQGTAARDSGGQERRELRGPEAEGTAYPTPFADTALADDARGAGHRFGVLGVVNRNSPLTEYYGGRRPSAVTFEEDVGNELQNMLERFEGDIRKLLYEKRRRCMMDTRASVKNINQKIERVWKTQEEQRQKLYHEYCQQFLTLLQEWDIDVQKAKEEEEKLANIFRQQQNVLQHSRTVQSQRMQAIKGLYEQFLKSVEDLEKNRENFLTGEQSELRKEMAMLQKHLMMEHDDSEGQMKR
ncbi:synaptonemal complex protein 3-like isoform X2 [Mirounga angustirostris]|uniref:synaptonemal complex protein 3-like isoform X2 n=1 Tax=Mirounga angustirostris TaxID=9716 RepID=UPI00313EDCA8